NNVSPGSGGGFFFVLDVITGAVQNKVPTLISASSNAGTSTTPSGLMKISAFYNASATDATFQYAYAGDQLGNVWRLDLGTSAGACTTPGSGTPPCVGHIATPLDGSGRAQPITTRPALTHIGSNPVLYIGTVLHL